MGSNASITDIKLDQNKIGRGRLQHQTKKNKAYQYIESFGEFFAVNQCLKSLSMASCDFDDQAIHKLCYGLKMTTTLQSLNLKDNEIGNEGAEEIALAFQEGKLRLTRLFLNDN